MKILITGANGQLGRDCVALFKKKCAVTSADLPDLDITDSAQVEEIIERVLPDVVLNCAAFTAVDASETERQSAWAVNVGGPQHLGASLARYGGMLVHISTDYVFDGRLLKGKHYREDTAINPISYYGKTKAEAESRVRKATANHLIVRTAWLYGRHGHNFLKTMLKLALSDPDREIKVVDDQYGSPTWSYRLALQLRKMIETGCKGTYHATAEGACTWFELASHFLAEMGLPHRVAPCTSAQYTVPAPRPQNAVLENHRLKLENINLMQPWERDLSIFIQNHGKALVDEIKNELASIT